MKTKAINFKYSLFRNALKMYHYKSREIILVPHIGLLVKRATRNSKFFLYIQIEFYRNTE